MLDHKRVIATPRVWGSSAARPTQRSGLSCVCTDLATVVSKHPYCAGAVFQYTGLRSLEGSPNSRGAGSAQRVRACSRKESEKLAWTVKTVRDWHAVKRLQEGEGTLGMLCQSLSEGVGKAQQPRCVSFRDGKSVCALAP